MKNLIFILFSIGILSAFTACGSDDAVYKPVSFNGNCKQTIAITGNEGQTITEPEVLVTLIDMLTASTPGYDGTRIASGELYLNQTFIRITGLEEGITLENFKLKINGSEKNFGNITVNEADLNKNVHMQYFSDVFNRMIKDNKLSIVLSYKLAGGKIEAADNVKFEINFAGKFTYNKKV